MTPSGHVAPGPIEIHYTELELRARETIAHCWTCRMSLPIGARISDPAVNRLLLAFQEVHPRGPDFYPHPWAIALELRAEQAVALDTEGQPHTAGELAAAATQLQALLRRHRTARDPARPLTCRGLRAAITVRQRLVTELWALELTPPARAEEP